MHRECIQLERCQPSEENVPKHKEALNLVIHAIVSQRYKIAPEGRCRLDNLSNLTFPFLCLPSIVIKRAHNISSSILLIINNLFEITCRCSVHVYIWDATGGMCSFSESALRNGVCAKFTDSHDYLSHKSYVPSSAYLYNEFEQDDFVTKDDLSFTTLEIFCIQ